MKKAILLLIPLLPFFFLNNSCKNKKPAPGVQDSYVEFTSDPPGALVEIAVDVDGNNFKPGTGRQIGATPVKAVLKDEDINDNGMVNFIMLRGGLTTIGQLKVDKPPVSGRTYSYHQKY
jgi:hypothetical protein